MGCDFPLKAWRTPPGSDQALTFNPLRALNSTNPMNIPCGRCTGCKLERSRQWAVRIMHEAQLHSENCFITLTFANEHLPVDYSVDPRHMQLFFKRLRKALFPKTVRFFLCGEYGELENRPHYHIILFNHSFTSDRLLYRTTQHEHKLYTSPSLSKVWPYGLATLGEVTFNSAVYTARYAMKKISGPKADAHYLREHPLHHFIVRTRPEFLLMSRKPGIGANWFNKFKSDVYPSDEVIVNGHKSRPPRFYDNQLTEDEQDEIKRRRRAAALPQKQHDNNRRRVAKRDVRDARIQTLKKDQL